MNGLIDDLALSDTEKISSLSPHTFDASVARDSHCYINRN